MQSPLLAQSGHRLVRCTCLLMTQSGHLNRADGYLLLRKSGLQRANTRTADIGKLAYRRQSSQLGRERPTWAALRAERAAVSHLE
jgi:hypothetical protein